MGNTLVPMSAMINGEYISTNKYEDQWSLLKNQCNDQWSTYTLVKMINGEYIITNVSAVINGEYISTNECKDQWSIL